MELQERLDDVRARIATAEREAGRAEGSVQLVAVSKTFDAEQIRPAIDAGQRIFGDNVCGSGDFRDNALVRPSGEHIPAVQIAGRRGATGAGWRRGHGASRYLHCPAGDRRHASENHPPPRDRA